MLGQRFKKKTTCRTCRKSQVGLMIGLELQLSSRVASLVFTTTVTCFAIAYSYYRAHLPSSGLQPGKPGKLEGLEPWDFPKHFGTRRELPYLLTFLACCFGVLGGSLSAKIGSGADMFPRLGSDGFSMVFHCWVLFEGLLKGLSCPRFLQQIPGLLTSSGFSGMRWCPKRRRSLRTCSPLPL